MFTYATKHPISLVAIEGKVEHEIDQCLHISEAFEETEEGETDRPKVGKEQTSAQDWKK